MTKPHVGLPKPAIDEKRRAYLDDLAQKGARAAAEFRGYSQEQVDTICRAMVRAGIRNARRLAEMARSETGLGVVEDKYLKNMVASEFTWDHIRDEPTVGVLREDVEKNLIEIAEPVGLILSLTPITNPTSTVIFKSIVAAKTANTLLFSPHSRAAKSSTEAARLMYEAGLAAGAPRHFLTWIEGPQREDTLYLLTHPLVQLIDATGGRGMVKVAYSSGKPALGVGSGNTPTYIHKSANLDMAAVDIVTSKTFDNGVICASEGTILIDAKVYDAVLERFRKLGAHLVSRDEAKALESILIDGETCSMRAEAAGRSAAEIAQFCGIAVPPGTLLLLVEIDAVGREVPLSAEKLCPVLTIHRVGSEEEALAKARTIQEFGGTGHTASLFADDDGLIRRYGQAVNAGRVIVNSPSSIGALGGVYNDLTPTFSFGCGTGGGTSVMDNVNVRHYINVKRVAQRTPAHQWFRVPSFIFFNRQSIENLRELEAATVAVVTTQGAHKRGFTDRVARHLPPATRVFTYTGLRSDPALADLSRAAAFLRERRPEAILAVGGGSVLDAAKLLRLLMAAPDADLRELATPFLDIRKRVSAFPKLAPGAIKLVAIPTTSGTGSEVSPFAVVNDEEEKRKLSLVDTSLVPDAAILDPEMTLSMSPAVTAATGMDALTHALEAGLSIYASEFTDALAYQAARLIFHHLPRVVRNGDDLDARTHMQNAAAIAGLAFSNASVGLTHALAHALGTFFPVPHGVANGIFLRSVLRYNAAVPKKITPNPNVKAYVAPKKIAAFCELMGLGRDGDPAERLVRRVEELQRACGLPLRIRDAGVNEPAFRERLDDLVDRAFEDPSLIANPRRPLLSEIRALFEEAY